MPPLRRVTAHDYRCTVAHILFYHDCGRLRTAITSSTFLRYTLPTTPRPNVERGFDVPVNVVLQHSTLCLPSTGLCAADTGYLDTLRLTAVDVCQFATFTLLRLPFVRRS